MIAVFHPFILFVDWVVPGDPFGTSENALLVAIPIHIAAFHTIFNVTNTLLFLPFIKPLEKVIRWIEPEGKKKEGTVLRYLSTPLSQTPELAITAARQEVDFMAEVVLSSLKRINTIIHNHRKNLQGEFDAIFKEEKTTDSLENEINAYLSDLAHAHLSTASNKEVHSLMSMINDLERMGDHGEKLAILFQRQKEGAIKFSPESIEELKNIAAKSIQIVEAMKSAILTQDGDPMTRARKQEEELNSLRDQMRQSHFERIKSETCSPDAGILFLDMLTSFEKMGDHAFNVVEATVGIK